MEEKIRKLLEDAKQLSYAQEEFLLDTRRHLHRIAEIGGNEVKTSAFVRAEADKLGLPVEKVSKTGLLITLDTGRPGAGVALRADMDALPVAENACNLAGPRSVMSDDPAVSHMCGHDCHTAILITAMRVLAVLRDRLSGTIYFCFEEGEENEYAYQDMLKALETRQVNTIFGLHVYSALEHGLVSAAPGPVMAGMALIYAVFHGKGGHGSRPDLAVSPVFPAAQAVSLLPAAFANQLDVSQTVTVGITSLQAGNTFNVIPDTAQVLGSLRFFDGPTGEKAFEVMQNVFGHTAAMNRCTVEYPDPEGVHHPVVNDQEAALMAEEAFGAVLPEGALCRSDPWYASDSFAEYLCRYRGVYAFLGVRNEELGCGAEHHNEYFDVDESALIRGVLCQTAYAIAALTDPQVPEWGRKDR